MIKLEELSKRFNKEDNKKVADLIEARLPYHNLLATLSMACDGHTFVAPPLILCESIVAVFANLLEEITQDDAGDNTIELDDKTVSRLLIRTLNATKEGVKQAFAEQERESKTH